MSRMVRTLLASLALLSFPVSAVAKSVLVIGAHPDDEVFMAAGRVRAALAAGDTIKVVIFTNGDVDGVSSGLHREQQSVESAQTLGLTEQDVIFLGYGDGLMRTVYDATSGSQVFTSSAGQTATYASYGLGGTDYHHYLYGIPGPYSRDTVVSDFRALLTNFHPDEIYTHSHVEAHGDHQACALFIAEALRSLKRSGVDVATKLYQTIIWMPSSSGVADPWPQLTTGGWTPLAPYLPWSNPCVPGQCLDQTQLEWGRLQHFVQPPEMVITDPSVNLKASAIPGGITVQGGWFGSWVRKEEFFWLSDPGTNLALTAQVSASSEDLADGKAAANANDGVVGGLLWSVDKDREWATLDQLAGSWIQLHWPAPVRIAQVNLFDRVDTTNNILAGTLSFSDGSSLDVGALPPAGQALPVTFPPKTVSWVRFTVTQAVGTAAGLSEIQVLGVPATSTANNPPFFVWGPVPASDTLPASQSTSVSVVANDLDGDPLQFQWSAEAGFIQGNGPTAVFTPPAVSSNTYLTITAQVLDGRGGTATNSTFVLVTPAPTDSITVSPSAVFGGSSAQGTILLATAAPAGGTVVPIASSDPAASVPASVTVPAGSTGATFPISTGNVLASTTVTISAAFPAGTRATSLTVVPPSVASVTVSPTSILGGNAAQGTVTLPLPVQSGATVQLSSAIPTVASVPATVTVPAGASTATFPIATTSVQAPTNVTISATYGTTTSTVLTVSPLGVSTVALDPAALIGGASSQGTVILNGVAPTDAVVALSSSDPTVATVPPSATIAAGADRTTFAVSTTSVAVTTTVSVTATLGSSSSSALLSVSPYVPPPPPATNLLANPEQIGGASWDVWGALTVTLNYAGAPDGSSHASRAVSSGGGHALRQAVAAIAGTTYTFSFYAQNNGGTAASWSVYDVTHGTEIIAPTSYFGLINGSSFTRVGLTFTAPAGCTSIAVYPLRDSAGPVDILLWGAKLEVGSTMTPYGIDTLTVSPGTVTSGALAQGTVTLAVAAPSGGTLVPLTSSAPAVASVPASVTVPGGATSASFTVATGAVATSTTATLSAALPSGTRTATLTVTPAPTVAGLTLSPTTVAGGVASTGTVTLTAAAPAGGASVALSSDDAAAATVPATVTVPAGGTSVTFTVTTYVVDTPTTANVTASYGGVTRTAALTVTTPSLSSLTLSPASVAGGGTSTGTVTLNGPSPLGGAVVTLSVDTAAATVPATVTVPGGATTATFTIGTSPVATTTTANVTAWYGPARTAALTIAVPALASVAMSPASVVGGTSSTGTVTLSSAAPSGGIAVALSSNSVSVTVPASVAIPSGATTATFTATTTSVSASTTATISATLGTTTQTATLIVTPATLSSVAVRPTSVVGGTSSTGTVTLTAAAPAGGVVVTLSDNSAAATVPPSVTVAAGATTATFTVTTVLVATNTSVTITATQGATTRTATLTVTAPTLSSLSLNPATLAGGSPSTGTVTLSGPAASAGVTVALSSNNVAATVPASVTVPGGARTATFSIATTAVTSSTNVTISARLGSTTRNATLSLRVLSVSALSLSPTSVVGGTPSTGTVTLNYPAVPGGFTVTLASSRTTVATVPPSVLVPEGATSTTFSITSLVVTASTSSSISASGGGTTRSATLTVTP